MTGLIILLPTVLTLVILSFFLNLFTSPFLGLMSSLLSRLPLNLPTPLITFLARISIIVLFAALIVLLGFLGRLFVFKQFLKAANKLLSKIPLLRGVYNTVQNITDAVFSEEKKAFKEAVRIPFPHNNSYTVGFVSGEVPEECRQKLPVETEPVFVPAAPYPITGFMLFVPKEKIKPVDFTKEETVQFIISCGAVVPSNGKPSVEASSEEAKEKKDF